MNLKEKRMVKVMLPLQIVHFDLRTTIEDMCLAINKLAEDLKKK